MKKTSKRLNISLFTFALFRIQLPDSHEQHTRDKIQVHPGASVVFFVDCVQILRVIT